MISEIIMKVVCFGYFSLSEIERAIYDEYLKAIENDHGFGND